MPDSRSRSSAHLLADLPRILDPLRADLELVGAKYRQILSDASRQSRDMVRHAARFNGKRLRPALTCIAARLAGGGVASDVATVAAIIELIHTATLVHDDILDSADVRRRVATVNARWGEHAAVLVGDVLFSKAYRAAAYLSDPFASRYLSDVVGKVIEGEIYQDIASYNPDLSETEYRMIIRGKTAALCEASVIVGAHYAGGDEALKTALGRYGHHLGMAFQIVDDQLDLAGDEQTVGKSLRTDLSEGKMTLPIILWLDAQEGEARDQARTLVERAWREESAGSDLCRALVDSGALERTARAAREEIAEARAALETLPPGPERDLLASIAGFVLSRKR
jgi:octaprenyl-diphosphate synthase